VERPDAAPPPKAHDGDRDVAGADVLRQQLLDAEPLDDVQARDHVLFRSGRSSRSLSTRSTGEPSNP
jgi:hypothetical protein